MAVQTWALIGPGVTPQKSQGVSFPFQNPGFEFRHEVHSDGKRAGTSLLTIDTGAAVFQICPERGMGLWKAKAGELELGWKSPVHGPIHPAFVPTFDPSGLGWLEGFDELFCRCGLQSNGAPVFDPKDGKLLYPLHGRIANLPAHSLTVAYDQATGDITVTGEVDEVRFHFQKLRLSVKYSFKAGSPRIQIQDVVTNLSPSPTEIQMLYHINLGLPLLDAGSRVYLAADQIVPRQADDGKAVQQWDAFAAPVPGFAEQVYFCKPRGQANGKVPVLLKNAHGNQGLKIVYDSAHLPCFSLWKNTTSEQDGYVTGLEPGTNFPNPRPFEGKHDRVIKLPGKGSVQFDLSLEPLTTQGAIDEAVREIAALQGQQGPKLEPAPLPGWCSSVPE